MVIHNCNSSYVGMVPKHTFLLWAQYLSPLKLWEVPGATVPLFLCSVHCQVMYSSSEFSVSADGGHKFYMFIWVLLLLGSQLHTAGQSQDS